MERNYENESTIKNGIEYIGLRKGGSLIRGRALKFVYTICKLATGYTWWSLFPSCAPSKPLIAQLVKVQSEVRANSPRS